MKSCPFCSLVDDHDDKCYFTLKAAGAMSGDLQRAWDRRATSDSPHVIPPTRGTGSDLDALVREYGNAPVTGPGRTRRIVMQEIYRAAGEIFGACESELPAGAAREGGGTIPEGITRYEEYGNESGGGLQEAADGDFMRIDDIKHLISSAPAAGTDKDAERYRHIRDTANNGYALNGPAGIGKWQVSRKMCGGEGEFFFGERMDAMIDRDIAAIGVHTNKESTK